MDNIVCYCSNVSRDEVVQAIINGAKTLEDIRKTTKACTIGRCKDYSPRKQCCSSEIKNLLNINKPQNGKP
jgi:NAD(P)H-nitrite reductase large subunit